MVSIFKFSELEMDKITYSNPYKLYNKTFFPIIYDSNKPLILQLPPLFMEEYSQNIITLSLTGKSNQISEEVTTFFSNLYNKIKGDLSSLIKQGKNIITYEGGQFTFKWCIYKQEEKPLIQFEDNGVSVFGYDKKSVRDKKNMSDLGVFTGTYMSSIIEFISICIEKNEIQIITKLHQLKMALPPIKKYSIEEYSFIDSDNEKTEDKVEQTVCSITTV